MILLRVGDLFAGMGALPAEATDDLRFNSLGIQYLVQTLDIPHDRPDTLKWPGLDV